MPPKKQQKKQIVRAFQPRPFWKYQPPTQQQTEKTNTFLTTFDKQLKELISLQKTLPQNYQLLCDKIGIAVHPCLQVKPHHQSEFPKLKNNDYGDHYIQIMNHKIDAVTLKLLGFLLSVFKVNSIKLSRNEVELEAEEVKKLLEKIDSVSTLFFEWNPLLNFEQRGDLFVGTVRPSIQHLILRDNELGDQIFKQIINKIKNTPEMCLKSLDVSGNCLTKGCSDVICKFVEQEKNIQYLNLSKNNLFGKKFLIKLFNSIGQIPLTEEEFAAHQEAVKARDQVVERNKKKKKGAADEPVPVVLQVKETENGRFFIKNTSLQMISLAKNGFGDMCGGVIKQFGQKQGKQIQLFLDGNKFTKKEKEVLKLNENILI